MDNINLEQKLEQADFYGMYANPGQMRFKFDLKLNNERAKTTRTFIFKRAVIVAAALAIFASAMGLTVFADEIRQALKTLTAGNITATQYDVVNNDPNVTLYAKFVSGCQLSQEQQRLFDENVNKPGENVSFGTVNEAADLAGFTPILAGYVPEGFSFNKISILKYGDYYLNGADICYENAADPNRQFIISETNIGDNGSIDVSSVSNFEKININGIDVITIFEPDTNRNHGFNFYWKDGSLGFQLSGIGLSYDEVYKIAESMIK